MKHRKPEQKITISLFHAAALLSVSLNDIRAMLGNGTLHAFEGGRVGLRDIERLIERREEREQHRLEQADFA